MALEIRMSSFFQKHFFKKEKNIILTRQLNFIQPIPRRLDSTFSRYIRIKRTMYFKFIILNYRLKHKADVIVAVTVGVNSKP